MARRFGPGLALLAMLAAVPSHAETAPAMLDFAALEWQYGQDESLGTARALLAQALPSGTSLVFARERLIGAGATCRVPRKHPDTTRCLIHQYSLADGAADDIRWTVSLTAPDGKLTNLAVERYVDRHGTA